MAQNSTSSSDQLVRTTPMPDLPPRYDQREVELLQQALNRNCLFYNQADSMVSRMLAKACQVFGSKHAVATSSGTASLHVAVAAAGVEAGAEVITSPICDFGTVIGILYQNAIPVFADVDPDNSCITAESIERVMTPRTQAVIAVHLAGVPCDIEAIAQLCKARGVKLIEDCAQSYGTQVRGVHVGNFGDIGAFSLNDFKVLGAGDGGFCLVNDEKMYHACHLYADKFYDRLGDGVRMHQLAPNYRMTDLQGAVGIAQLEKFERFTRPRHELGRWLSNAIADIPGVVVPRLPEGGRESFWFYLFRVDEAKLGMKRDEFSARLQALGIPAGAGYLARPIYQERVFLDKAFFAGGIWPAELIAKKTYDYRGLHLPGTELACATCVRLPLHQGFTQRDVEDYARAIRLVATGR